MFIHILRDGRAVANSYYNCIRSGSFMPWKEREWWVRAWPEEWRQEWRKNYHNELGLAAYLWKYFVNQIRIDARNLPEGHYMEIQYEELISSPKSTINRILGFYGVPLGGRIEWYLNQLSLSNMNIKWRSELNQDQKKDLERIIHEKHLRALFER
jgi:hypothetical protein